MTAINPPQYKTYTIDTSTDAFGRPRESYGLCAYDEQGWFFLALAILNGSILVLSVFQSWQARGLATEFSESKYVFLALASITVVIFVGAPVLVLARDNPNAVLFLGSSINFVCKFVLAWCVKQELIFMNSVISHSPLACDSCLCSLLEHSSSDVRSEDSLLPRIKVC